MLACTAQSRYIFPMNMACGQRRAPLLTPSLATATRLPGGLHLLAVLGPLLRPAR